MAKKKVAKSGWKREVNDIWGWVVLTIGIFAILAIAGWYYYTML